MRILIAGAGVAGLTTAYWLKRYGFMPTIIEKSPSLPTGGYKIDVRGSALHVLRKMNVYDEVADASTDMQGAILVDKNGKHLCQMTGDAFGHRVNDDIEIIRGTLCTILMDQLTDIECIFGESIQEMHEKSHSIEVTFTNNTRREFELVIGADGVHSIIRQLIFNNEEQANKDIGLYLCVFTTPNYLNLDRIEMQYSELGRIAAIWSARGDQNMKACFGFTAPSATINLRDRTQQQQALKEMYSDINWEVPQLLQMMDASTDFYFDRVTQITLESWSSGRVALVGDAAFCPSPMSGQGTSLALIGAYILAGELAAAKGQYHLAFDQYDNQLRSFAESNQALGTTAANLMKSQQGNRFLMRIIMLFMRIMPGRLIKFFINLSSRRINRVANSISLKDYGF